MRRFALVGTGVLLVMASSVLGEKPRAWMDKNWRLLEELRDAPMEDQLNGLKGVLGGIGNYPVEQRTSEESELYRRVQDQLTSIPGYAEYYEKQIIDYKESRGRIRPTLGWSPRYAFQTLQHLPSPETARVLAGLLDHSDDDHGFEGGSTAMRAAISLKKLLEDPPPYNTGWTEKWLEWRQEVRDGKRTFRFKERKGVYNFEGPVAQSGPREERRPPAGDGAVGNTADGSRNGGPETTKSGGQLRERKVLWFALSVLLAALVVYVVLRLRRGGK